MSGNGGGSEFTRWLAVVPLSDSFRGTIDELARTLSLDVVELGRGSQRWPPDVVGAVVLAGGEESAALEVLEGLPDGGLPRWLVGARTDHRIAAAAVARGAADYLALPEDLDLLRRTVSLAASHATAREAAAAFAATERRDSGFEAMLGRHPGFREVLDRARRVAQHRDVTVLLGGETGTGKELLARAVHYHSPRAAAPFVEINCAAIPANLLESELFGHEKGAFTGAVTDKPGLFELADGGTVFLDEVGHLPLDLQPKLLRALESREVRRVGGRKSRRLDVRLVSATHLDLAEAVREGVFREDLYYRLNVVRLDLPPLRSRGGDIELLAEAFTTRLAREYDLGIPPLSPEVRSALRAHAWPGNVRELRNAIERALVLSPPGTLLAEHLLLAPTRVPAATGRLPFPASLRAISRAAVLATLEQTNGNKSEAARRLEISRPRLQRLLDGGPE